MYRCKRCQRELQGNSEFCVQCYSVVWTQCYGCNGKGRVRNRERRKASDPYMLACKNCKGQGWCFRWDGKTVALKEEIGRLSMPDSPVETGKLF